MYGLLLLGIVFLIRHSTACTAPAFSTVPVQTNFSMHRFVGTWYQIEWFSSEPDNEFNKAHDFSQSFDFEHNSSKRLLVLGKARMSQEERCLSFGPWLLIVNDSAKMVLEKKDLNSTTNLSWPYYILKTDYEHYALIYGCIAEKYILANQCDEPVLRVFSRTATLAEDYLNTLDAYIENSLCINVTSLEKTIHGQKSCYTSSASGHWLSSMKMISCFIVLILYLFRIFE